MAIAAHTQKKPLEKVVLKEGSLTLGRAGDNDVRIKDATVSSHHAHIFTYLSASYIEDLGSTNGTYVNGSRVTKHTLHCGDVVAVGTHQFKVDSEQPHS